MNDFMYRIARRIALVSVIFCNSIAASLDTNIVIPLHEWESHQAVAHLTGKLLSKIGYTVRFVYQSPIESFQHIRNGTVSLDPEVWTLGSNAQNYYDALGQGGIVSAGDHIAKANFGWWVPESTLSLCPILPNWHGLNQCFRKFTRGNDFDKGVYFTTDNPESHTDFIQQFHLRFRPEVLESTNDLQNEIEHAYKRNKAIAVFNWGPGPHQSRLKGKFIEFPHQPSHWLTKICHYNLPKQQPLAYRLLQQIQLTNEDIIEMTTNMLDKSLTPNIAARMWIRDHPDRWNKWLDNLQPSSEDNHD